MKFLLTCMAALLLAANVELQKQGRRQKINAGEEFEKASITTDSCITAPPDALQIVFNVDITVNFGNTIYPQNTMNITSLGYYSSPNCLYTVILLDIDAPYTCKPYMSPWLVGMYSNIRNSDIKSADETVVYIPATPVAGDSLHRIVIMLYLQIEEIDITSDCMSEYSLYRAQFPLEDFMYEYGLTPMAGNYYMTGYPNQMQQVCGQYCEQYCGDEEYIKGNLK